MKISEVDNLADELAKEEIDMITSDPVGYYENGGEQKFDTEWDSIQSLYDEVGK